MSTLYNRIEALCERDGISGYRLCKSIGMSPNVLSELKSGRRKSVSAENAKKITEYFCVTLDYLLQGETEKSPIISDGGRALNDVERELIFAFREFSDEGQKKVLDYVSDLQNAGIYKRDYQPEMVSGK